MQIKERLDSLVSQVTLKSYTISNVSADGIVNEESNFRNTERLVLTFPDDETLTLETFCSGCAEDTCFV